MEESNIEEQPSRASINQDARTDQRKKVWCWRKKATKLNLYILETLQWGITTLQKREKVLRQDINVVQQKINLQQDIGAVNILGQEVVVKELQRHPATSKLIHADFMRVDPDSKISLTVPIRTIHDDICIGVKISGGQVNHLINDVEITCLASNLPEYLEIDVQEMDIGDSVLLSEITLPEGVEITILNQSEERDQAVVSVTEAREMIIEEEIIEEVEEGEPVEGEEETVEGETEDAQKDESTEKKDQGSSKEQEQD